MLLAFPMRITAAKIVPPGVEGTMMAFSITMVSMNLSIVRNMLGALLNHTFIHVTHDNIETEYYKLTLVKLVLAFVPFAFIFRLLPKNKDVK